jgi:hypothetical protein
MTGSTCESYRGVQAGRPSDIHQPMVFTYLLEESLERTGRLLSPRRMND